MALQKLTIGDFQNKFRIDTETHKLYFDGNPVATEVVLRNREFFLAVAALVIAAASCAASWVSAKVSLSKPSPQPITCPTPRIDVTTAAPKVVVVTSRPKARRYHPRRARSSH